MYLSMTSRRLFLKDSHLLCLPINWLRFSVNKSFWFYWISIRFEGLFLQNTVFLNVFSIALCTLALLADLIFCTIWSNYKNFFGIPRASSSVSGILNSCLVAELKSCLPISSYGTGSTSGFRIGEPLHVNEAFWGMKSMLTLRLCSCYKSSIVILFFSLRCGWESWMLIVFRKGLWLRWNSEINLDLLRFDYAENTGERSLGGEPLDPDPPRPKGDIVGPLFSS